MARGDGAYAHYGWDEARACLRDYLLDQEEMEDGQEPTPESVEAYLDGDRATQREWEIAWETVEENMSCDMDMLMESVQSASGHKGEDWVGDRSNFGWRHISGSGVFHAGTGMELLSAALPETENDYYVFDHGTYIAIDNAHHDAPMGGETYQLYPASAYQVWEVLPREDADDEPERLWEREVWASSAVDAAERAFGCDDRTGEPRYRCLAAGPDDTATGDGWGGYPDERWFGIRVERA